MANLKSSKKDIRRIARRTENNKPFRRNAKMLPKKFRKLVATGNITEAVELLPTVQKALGKAARKNIIHKNNAARTLSRLNVLLAKAQNANAEVKA